MAESRIQSTRRAVLGAAIALPAVAATTTSRAFAWAPAGQQHFEGTPSDQLPDVLAVGGSNIQYTLISMSARDPKGRDAAYLEWHTLDHRPEYHRLHELRASLRLVSTPAARKARAANSAPFDAVDHIMSYHFTSDAYQTGFHELTSALYKSGRVPYLLPSVTFVHATVAGKVAAARAGAGADVLPWRPALGVYMLVEQGHATPEALLEVPGVAGIWWHDGLAVPQYDHSGCQVTYCYLDDDPIAVARKLHAPLERRWASGEIKPLLAAPFYSVVPFAWDRHLP